jgi:uncharacterized RDD family membrane protein YckC
MSVRSEKSLLARRLAARVIDCWLVGFLLLASWGFSLVLMLGDCPGEDSGCEPSGLLRVVVLALAFGALLLGAGAPILYDFLGLRCWQTTIGKFTLGLRVARLDGTRLGWWRCLIRSVAFWLSVPAPIVAIYAALAPASEAYRSLTVGLSLTCIIATFIFFLVKRRAFHDWVAGSRVACI